VFPFIQKLTHASFSPLPHSSKDSPHPATFWLSFLKLISTPAHPSNPYSLEKNHVDIFFPINFVNRGKVFHRTHSLDIWNSNKTTHIQAHPAGIDFFLPTKSLIPFSHFATMFEIISDPNWLLRSLTEKPCQSIFVISILYLAVSRVTLFFIDHLPRWTKDNELKWELCRLINLKGG
jgi:hypothetical protein